MTIFPSSPTEPTAGYSHSYTPKDTNLLSNGKDGGILKEVYYAAYAKYYEDHGEQLVDPISQNWGTQV